MNDVRLDGDDDTDDQTSHWGGLVNIAADALDESILRVREAADALSAAAETLSALGDQDGAIRASEAGLVALAAAESSVGKMLGVLSAAHALAAAELEETEAEIDELLDRFDPAD